MRLSKAPWRSQGSGETVRPLVSVDVVFSPVVCNPDSTYHHILLHDRGIRSYKNARGNTG